MTATVSDAEIADVLERAAARIEPLPGTTQWRWCRGWRRGTKRCAESAVAFAAGRETGGGPLPIAVEKRALHAVRQHLGETWYLFDWNDHVAKSGREVAETFRRVARELRGET